MIDHNITLPDVPIQSDNWPDLAISRAVDEYENCRRANVVEQILLDEFIRHARFERDTPRLRLIKEYFDHIVETYKNRETIDRMEEVSEVLENFEERREQETREVEVAPEEEEVMSGWFNAYNQYSTTTTTTQNIILDSVSRYLSAADSLSCFDEDDDEDDEAKKEIDLKKMNTPDKRSWLKFPMGVEYTHHFPSIKIRDNEDKHEYYLEKIREALDLEDSVDNIAKVYVDGGDVVEICSPVYRTWKEAKRDYLFMTNETKRLKLVAWSPKRGGGGGHINPAIPKKDGLMWTDYMRNLLVDTANRPYLGWIFNEPSDNHTANCLWDDSNMLTLYNDYNSNDLYNNRKSLITHIDNRGYSIRIKDENHFEFRLFDMVRNLKDLKDHLKFTSAYMTYIEKKTLAGEFIEKSRLKKVSRKDFWKKDYYYNISKKQIVKEFKKLLVLLDLDYKDYRRFVERNLYVRVNTYGRNHLI